MAPLQRRTLLYAAHAAQVEGMPGGVEPGLRERSGMSLDDRGNARDELDERTKDGLAARAVTWVRGECPSCGATPEVTPHLERGVAAITFLHDAGGPVSELLLNAASREHAATPSELTQTCHRPRRRPHLPWPMRARWPKYPAASRWPIHLRGVIPAPLHRPPPVRARNTAQETRPPPRRVSRAAFLSGRTGRDPRIGISLPTQVVTLDG